MHPPDPETTAQAHRMVAQCRHNCAGPGCHIDTVREAYLEALNLQLPDVDPAVIARVAMATVTAAVNGIRYVRPMVRNDYEAHEGALAMLGAAAAQLYLDTAQESPAHAPASPL